MIIAIVMPKHVCHALNLGLSLFLTKHCSHLNRRPLVWMCRESLSG